MTLCQVLYLRDGLVQSLQGHMKQILGFLLRHNRREKCNPLLCIVKVNTDRFVRNIGTPLRTDQLQHHEEIKRSILLLVFTIRIEGTLIIKCRIIQLMILYVHIDVSSERNGHRYGFQQGSLRLCDF
ncbi:hypothetical protein D3C73_1036900 [compost metagenome]